MADWSPAVWINVVSGVITALSSFAFIFLAYRNRGRLSNALDGLGWGITAWLAMILVFFAARAIQVANAGKTVAGPAFLTINVLMALVSVLTMVLSIRVAAHDDSLTLWRPGDRERRNGEPGRRKTDYTEDVTSG